ncbi:MAG: acyl-CoA dehydrogenase [Gammaproteobacteria bacterium]|nr:acyl-CoA dehydrogenase [Gammaproteobacteria bacterium]|tara:strand:+ start:54 stop:1238 length:1185 start_codon:yes stop_codon:yes gene_type:complete
MDLATFRAETRAWLEENCPQGARGVGPVHSGSRLIPVPHPDLDIWLERMAEKGWTTPTWPAEYGGAGLSTDQYLILLEEMRAVGARAPLSNRGTTMVGPTILEYGTEEQKRRLLPMIARGEGAWCQGYSEPGAGSDLASLRTTGVLDGDQYVINGHKIWTSDGDWCEWMFLIIRTNPDASKHEGISFFVMKMDQPGVTVKPIRMISGASPFCETFFDDAIADKRDMIGKPNEGWTVGKRLLQHERSGMEMLAAGATSSRRAAGIVDIARAYVPTTDAGRIAEPATRDAVINQEMQTLALRLTQRRIAQESSDGRTPGPATSIMKIVSTEIEKDHAELTIQLMGTQGQGWEGAQFSEQEVAAHRRFLSSRAASIYSGSNEIQANIIAKRVLGLPD